MNEDIKPVRGKKAAPDAADVEVKEPAFVPPEKLTSTEPVPKINKEATPEEMEKTPVRVRKIKLTKRKWFGLVGVVAVILLVSAVPIIALRKDKPAPAPAPTPVVEKKVEEPPKPTTEASRLTGVQISPELNKLPVTSVMIENSPDARPQSGLTDAGVVFEAIAEGGITRFNALFMESQPGRIGPVRSVRPYYIDFFAPFDAPIAHAGGSGAALAKLRDGGFKDLDQFANGNYYYRDSNRYAPHNLYTTRAKLLELQNAKGWTTSTFTGFVRKDKETKAETPTARTMDFSISGYLYNPHWDYDAATNTYKRSEGGKPHVDESTGAQIAPKVVLALVMSHYYDGIYSVYGTTGSGKLFLFQDGVAIEGTWSKADTKSQFVFTDTAGKPLPLNPGQTWISIVASTGAVTYAP